MINYNPKEWFTFIFRFSKADTFRKLLPLMIGVAIYSALIAYLELNYIKLADSSYIRNIGMMHNVLGFVISLLLVFRTNTAYERWWEGRRIWGSLTNSSRNLAIKVNAIIKDVEDKVFFKNMIPAYAFALKDFLQEKVENHELVNNIKIDFEKHVPNQIASAMYERFNNINHNIDLSTGQFLAINEELKAFTDICGGCERIKNTPIPFTYSVFIKKFIFFYVMTLPFGWVFSLAYFTIPVVVLILYALASLEIIAEEIENPFGNDANDLPLQQICENIQKHVREII